MMFSTLRFLCLLLAVSLGIRLPAAEDSSPSNIRLSKANFKNGEETLHAFASVSRLTRQSVVKIDRDGITVALAAVIRTDGLALTKASEIRGGKLTCWLPSG